MRTQKEITENIKGVGKKLKEHEANYKKFGWHRGTGHTFVNAECTKTYMMGWINGLKWVIRHE